MIAPVDPDHSEGYRALEALADRQVDGLIAVSPRVDPRWLEEMSRRIPIVMLGRHDSSVGYDTVVGDDVAGVADADAAPLRARPPRDRPPHPRATSTRARGRARRTRCGSRRTRRRCGRPGSRAPSRSPGATAARTVRTQATLRLLASGARPTAIFAAHDELAIGVLSALTRARPDAAEISVAGYDNIKQAGHPLIGLTSVDQPGEQMGGVGGLAASRAARGTDGRGPRGRCSAAGSPELHPAARTRRGQGVT